MLYHLLFYGIRAAQTPKGCYLMSQESHRNCKDCKCFDMISISAVLIQAIDEGYSALSNDRLKKYSIKNVQSSNIVDMVTKRFIISSPQAFAMIISQLLGFHIEPKYITNQVRVDSFFLQIGLQFTLASLSK